jgi:formamidopyrimidine-DNA glycosylase
VPELPEVHALAADLRARLGGRRVRSLRILAFSALKTVDPPLATIEGCEIVDVARFGKHLDLVLRDDEGDDLHLVLHLARAGWIRWRAAAPRPARPGAGPTAAQLVLEGIDGSPGGDGLDITEAGTKKSLAIWLVRSPEAIPGVARLGPDPLAPDFAEADFARILAGAGRARIKGVLRDQSRIAGIGNAYSDEILHTARMSPFAPASMPPAKVAALFEAMRATLQSAVDRADGVAAADLKREKKTNLRVHGRFGEPCPGCGDTIRQVIYADSTFQYCPTCQTGGKPLADRVLSRLLK